MLRTLATSRSRRACLSHLSSSSCFQLLRYLRPPDPTPSLQPHYRAFLATTSQSVPVPGFSTLASRFAPLVLLPWHPGSGSRSSTQKPVPDSCPLYAGRRPSSLQAPDGLIPVVWTAPGFDDTYGYRRVLEGLLSLSFRTPTCPESCPGLSFRRSPPRLFAAAARTGLRPALKADPDGPTIISCAASRHGSVPLELLPCLCGTRPQGPQALGSNGASRLWTLWATRLP